MVACRASLLRRLHKGSGVDVMLIKVIDPGLSEMINPQPGWNYRIRRPARIMLPDARRSQCKAKLRHPVQHQLDMRKRAVAPARLRLIGPA